MPNIAVCNKRPGYVSEPFQGLLRDEPSEQIYLLFEYPKGMNYPNTDFACLWAV